ELLKQLPDQMIPRMFVFLDDMPLTSTGKTNKRILPAPDFTSRESTRDLVPPRDGLEAELCGIWEKVLKISPIGIYDRFVEIGGDSLKAAEFVIELEKRRGINLPMASL